MTARPNPTKAGDPCRFCGTHVKAFRDKLHDNRGWFVGIRCPKCRSLFAGTFEWAGAQTADEAAA